MNRKNFIFMSLRIGVSLGLLTVLILLFKNNLGDFYKIISGVKMGLFIPASFLLVIIVIFSAFRLKTLFDIQKINFSRLEMIKMSFMAIFFNSFMPSTFGGDIIKLYYARGRAKNLIKPFSSLFIDRLIGAVSLAFLAASVLAISGGIIQNNSAKSLVWFFFFGMILLVVFLFSDLLTEKISSVFFALNLKKLGEETKNVHKIISVFKRSPKVIQALFYGLVMQSLNIFYAYLLSRSLGLNLPLGIFFVFVPLIQVVSLLPSLGGLGIREGAFVYFFKEFVSPEYALAISILYLGPMLFITVFGGVVYMFYGRINKQEVICD